MRTAIYLIGGILGLVLVVAVGAVVYLSTLDFNAYKPQIAQAVRDATGRELTIEGPVDLKIGLSPALAMSDVRLANAEWGAAADMVSIGRAEAQVHLIPLLSGGVEVERFILTNVTIALERQADGTANWVFGSAASTPQPVPGRPEDALGGGLPFDVPVLKDVQIENVQVSLADAVTERTVAVAIDRLVASVPGPDLPLTVAADARFNDADIRLDATLRAFDRLLQRESSEVDADIAIGDAQVSVRGAASTADFDLVLTAQVPDLGTLGQALDTPLPALAPIDARVRLLSGRGRLEAQDLDVTVGESRITGTAQVETFGVRPVVQLALTAPRLDVADLTPGAPDAAASDGAAPDATAPDEAGAEGTPDDGRVIPDIPLPVDALKQVDVDATVSVAQLIAAPWEVRNVELEAVMADGNVVLRRLDAAVAGGTVSATGDLTARTGPAAMTLDATLAGIDLSQVMDLVAGDPDLGDGVLGGKIDLTARGDTTRALAASLDGRADFLTSEGRIASSYVDLLGGELLTQLPFIGLGADGVTVVNCFVVGLVAETGQVTAQTFVFDTQRMTVTGSGGANLGDESLDFLLSPRAKTPGLSLGTPIRVGGTFAQPSFGPDTAALAGSAAKIVGGVAAGAATGGLSLLLPLITTGTGGGTMACGVDGAVAPEAETGASGEPASTDPAEGVGRTLRGLFGQ